MSERDDAAIVDDMESALGGTPQPPPPPATEVGDTQKEPGPKKRWVNTKPTEPIEDHPEAPLPLGHAQEAIEQAAAVPTEYPNPLELSLTECHLPKAFISNRSELAKYVGRYLEHSVVRSLSPSRNERALYGRYVRLASRAGERPVTSRLFSAAVRCIANGKPVAVKTEKPIDASAL